MKDRFIISSGDLSAVVLAPESPAYAKTRFNHSAFVFDVTYKGVSFCQPEQVDPAKKTSLGQGLCSQLICPDVEQTAAVGGEYLKPGIGYLTRQEKPWDYMDINVPYRPFDTIVTAQSDRILFVTEPEPLNSLAYRECRLLKAEGNTLTLSVHFENQGELPLDMLDYCHNFISLGSLPTGKTHHLALPCVAAPDPDPEKNHLLKEDGGVTWPETPAPGFFCSFMDVRKPDGYSWRLSCDNNPLAMSETDDFTPVQCVVWGLEHVVSTEVMNHVALNPGESADWSRVWTFEA